MSLVASRPLLKNHSIKGSTDAMFGPKIAFERSFYRLLQRLADRNLLLVGQHFVHGGNRFTQLACVKPDLLTQVDGYTQMTPLHQPDDFFGILAIASVQP